MLLPAPCTPISILLHPSHSRQRHAHRRGGNRIGIPFVTRENGGFVFTLPSAGRFAVRAARIGYTPVESRLFHVRDGEEVFAEVVMRPVPATMSPVTTEEERSRAGTGPLADYEYRRRRGLGGTFVTKEQIAMNGHVRVDEVLSGVVGVQVIGALRRRQAGARRAR